MIANQIAKQQKFQHWELEFADLFAERDGFDLIIGNPPWLLVGWNEQSLLSDKNPLFSIKNLTAIETVHQREEALKVVETRNSYYSEYESVSGMQNFLNAYQNYAILIGMKTNLFKCFLPQAWQFGNGRGISAFIHPEGVYDDPLGGALREKLYERLRMHFQFANENKLFREVDHHMLYSINVYGSALQISFDSISNLYDPDTISQCYNNDQLDAIPNIKDDNGNWNLKGHPKRIIHVGKEELLNFANVFDGNGQFRRARLPVLHVQQLVEVIKLISNYDLKIQSIEKEIYATNMFDETQSQKKGIIEKNVHFPDSGIDLILSGPHIGLANPLFKASRQICKINSDYDKIDLTYISNDYKQRCNYAPVTSIEEYLTKVPDINENCKYTEKYRLLSRIMLNTSGERTLISAIVPPKIGHINGLIGMCCNKNNQLAAIGSTFASLLFDFFVKITGMSNLRISTIYRMPLIYDKHLIIRYLLLNCLTENYLIMWNDCWDEEFKYDSWMKNDRRLSDKFHKLDQKLNLDMVFKTDFERREALIEIDVLVAMNLKMSLQQLKVIYQVQFPVLQSYESDTWYDQNGRIVFTNNRSLTGVGYSRQEWEAIKNVKEGVFTQIITDDTMLGGPIERTIEYVAPFDRCDREKDYEEVWHNFEERFKDKK